MCFRVQVYTINVVPWIGLWAVIVAFPGPVVLYHYSIAVSLIDIPSQKDAFPHREVRW